MKKNSKKIIRNIRINILKSTFRAQSSHIGSCFSIVEILYTLYFLALKKRDSFILSKGHAALALYAVLCEKKLLSKFTLNSYGKDNSKLMSHVSHFVKNIEFSTGSLGHGLPYATGKALGEKMNKKNNNVYVLISDGELNEGTTWESLLFASSKCLDNLNVIVDYNKIQSLDFINNVIPMEPLNKKFQSFNCNVKCINGHNIDEILNALRQKKNNKPNIIVAHTIKGRGISFMENSVLWHYKSPNRKELIKGLEELR